MSAEPKIHKLLGFVGNPAYAQSLCVRSTWRGSMTTIDSEVTCKNCLRILATRRETEHDR